MAGGESLEFHRKYRGKVEVVSKVPLTDKEDLSLAYTPGVAEACLEIQRNSESVWELTSKWNNVAVVTDSTAILGLGDIGSQAGLPLAEGKCVLFKRFAGIDAYPICLSVTEVEKVVDTVCNIAPTFGGINLEDISAPRCFEIEKKLKARLEIPIFHDDQHGTAIVVLGGLLNALKIVDKHLSKVKIVITGAGAAGIAISKILFQAGAKDIIMCDSMGAIFKGRNGLNKYKEEIAERTNKEGIAGSLADALAGADVFVGVSVANLVTPQMVRKMGEDPIIFAMANPVPEIMPEKAREGGARVVATGRSDLPNQVNNLLGFPGVFRGALDVRARDITDGMKITAANAIADIIPEPTIEKFIPEPFNQEVVPAVARAVATAAMAENVAQVEVDPETVAENARKLVAGKL